MVTANRFRAAALVLAVGFGLVSVPAPVAAADVRAEGGSGDAGQWYFPAIAADRAQRLVKGDGVTVAVVDTGVDGEHPDLRGRVLPGATVTTSGEVDAGDPGNRDLDGHGTAMAGLIAGQGGDGPLGVAPRAMILPVRVMRREDGALDPDHVYEGVRWAIAQGAQVVSLSLSGRPTEDAPWKSELISYAIQNDVVLVAAAGNRAAGDVRVGEPAAIPGVVAVSGLGRDGSVWDGSVTGGAVVLSAPAEDLPHLTTGGGWRTESGTSGAAAIVAGVAALIRSRYWDAGASGVVNRLIRTAHDEGRPGRDPGFGYGSVDAYEALTAAVPPLGRYPLEVAESPPAALTAPPEPAWPGWWAVGAGATLLVGVAWVAVRGGARRGR